MLTYDEATTMMGRAKNGRRKLENNTCLEARNVKESLDDGKPVEFAVRLHNTDVVTLHKDGTYTLDSGGWQTVATKDRMNRYGPANVASNRGQWQVSRRGDWSKSWPYADGMRLAADGTPLDVSPDMSKTRAEVDKLVRNYIRGFWLSVKGKGLTEPSGGDCWGCRLTAAKDGEKLPPGKEFMGVDHYFSHVREKYYVPSLLWKAMQRRGDPGFCWQLADADAKRGRDSISSDLRAYFKPLKPALTEYLWNHPGAMKEDG